MANVQPRSYLIHGNSANFYGYSPQQLADGFDFSGAYSAGFNGAGINVGIIGTGPILNANGGDDDTAALAQLWNAKLGNITQVAASPQPATTANGNTGTGAVDANPTGLTSPPPVTSPSCTPTSPFQNYQLCNPEDGEAQLDTESVASLAPGATTLFYMAFNAAEACYNPTTSSYDPPTGTTCPSGDDAEQAEGIGLSDDEIQQAIADNKADAISMSFGLPENLGELFGYIGTVANPGPGQVEIASLTAEGMAVFVSSGDNGAWECFDPNTGLPTGTACVSYPASDQNAVAVGGVNIPLDEAGNLTGSISAWADNTTQGGNGAFQNNVGSGGGVSADFTAPAWQAADDSAQAERELPDIALDADPNTGPGIVFNAAYNGGPRLAIGGTSAAAPESAAQWAIVLQACKASATCNKGRRTGISPRQSDRRCSTRSTGNRAARAAPYTVSGIHPALNYARRSMT